MSSVERSELNPRITLCVFDVSLPSEIEETVRKYDVSVIESEKITTVRDCLRRERASCLLVSASTDRVQEVLAEVSNKRNTPPVIFVIDNSDDIERLLGHEQGPVEYIHRTDLHERPALVVHRIETVLAAAKAAQEKAGANEQTHRLPDASSKKESTVPQEGKGLETEAETLTNLRRLFNEAPDTILVHDADGRILDVNRTAVETLGYSREELLAMYIEDIEVGIDSAELESAWNDSSGTEPITVEGSHRHVDGTEHPVEVWVTKTEVETETRFIAIARDVRKRKQYEQTLETQRDNLETLNQVVRHDIRNDLQIVNIYAELLEDHVDEQGRSHLETLRESVSNAVDLTTTARELAAVMLQSEVQSQRVSLREILTTQIEKTRTSYPNATLTAQEPVPAVTVLGTNMLNSVFRNLLKNAVQHNDKAVPEVGVSVTEHDEYVTVRVADNGPGIPDSRKTEIFGQGERGLESEGTGVGLYLVQSLLDSVGGDVWVEDRQTASGTENAQQGEADGAVFAVKLPRVE